MCFFFAVQIINVSHDRNILNVNTSAKILQFEISFTDKQKLGLCKNVFTNCRYKLKKIVLMTNILYIVFMCILCLYLKKYIFTYNIYIYTYILSRSRVRCNNNKIYCCLSEQSFCLGGSYVYFLNASPNDFGSDQLTHKCFPYTYVHQTQMLNLNITIDM